MARNIIKFDVPEAWTIRLKAGLCPVCGKEPSQFGKSQRVYCSVKCREEYAKHYSTWQEVKNKFLFSHGEFCDSCGLTREKSRVIGEEKNRKQLLKWAEDNKDEIERLRAKRLVELDKTIEEELRYINDDCCLAKSLVPYDFLESNYVTFDVDHVKPIALGGDMWSESNFQVLCHDCHVKKTAEDMKKMKEAGVLKKR